MPRKFVTEFIPDFINVRENRRGTNNRQSRNVDNIGHKTENEDKQKQKQKTTRKLKRGATWTHKNRSELW